MLLPGRICKTVALTAESEVYTAGPALESTLPPGVSRRMFKSEARSGLASSISWIYISTFILSEVVETVTWPRTTLVQYATYFILRFVHLLTVDFCRIVLKFSKFILELVSWVLCVILIPVHHAITDDKAFSIFMRTDVSSSSLCRWFLAIILVSSTIQ